MASNNTQDQLINLQAQQLAAQVANWAAQLDFQKARFNQLELPEWQQKSQLEVDQFAWQKAQDTWENAYKEALVTGTYQGQPTIDWLTRQAQLTGVLNGQQTLQGKLTDAQISQMNQQMKLANDQFLANSTGYVNGVPTFDREQWMANTTGYTTTPGNPLTAEEIVRYHALQEAVAGRNANGDPQTPSDLTDIANFEARMRGDVGGIQTKTFAREQWEAAQAVTGWQFLSTLSGPQNAFKQARAIASMPAGLGQMMDAWAGNYVMPGSTAVGAGTGGLPGYGGNAGSGPSLGDMMLGAAGNTPTGQQAATILNPASISAPAVAPYSLDASGTPVAGYDYSATPTAQPTPVASGGPAYTYSAPGVQAPAQAWNYTPLPSGSVQVHPPGVASPPETPDYSTTTPQQPGTITDIMAQSGGQYTYGSATSTGGSATQYQVPTTGLANATALAPNQINAENYRNMYQYQKDLGWAAFEDAGWDKGLAQEAFKKSLPTYVNPTQGKIAAF